MQSRLIAMLAVPLVAVAAPADAQRIAYPQQVVPQPGLPQPALSQPGLAQHGLSRAPIAPAAPLPPIRPAGTTTATATGGGRWGGQVQGRWAGGHDAPGGWNAYHRPVRGWTLPVYWVAPSFTISNYGAYGLSVPPLGYNWSRYYDDAVLIDGRGRIYDMIGGVDWDRYDGGYQGTSYQGTSYHGAGYRGDAGYPVPPRQTPQPPQPPLPHHGAGFSGSYQGQAGYGAPYGQPGYGYEGSYQGHYTPAPDVVYAQPAEIVQPVSRRHGRVKHYASGGYPETDYRGSAYPAYGYSADGHAQQGYASDGYSSGGGYSKTIVTGGYPGVTTTTITIASAPVITTTTTEYVTEYVYHRPVVRKARRATVHKWRPRRQCTCR